MCDPSPLRPIQNVLLSGLKEAFACFTPIGIWPYDYVMDTYGSVNVAGSLNVSLPRLLRAVEGREDVYRDDRGRVRLRPSALEYLVERFGIVPKVEGLSRIETQVLVALSRHPRGLISIRQVAKAARVSPKAATKALKTLVDRGYAVRLQRKVFDGQVSDHDIYEVDWRSPLWREVAPVVSTAKLPTIRSPERPRRRLPPRLANVFWTGDWRKVDIQRSSASVVDRILDEGSRSPEAISFLGELPEDAIRSLVSEDVATVRY